MLVHPQFDPIALQIGPVAIHWYGLTYLVAFGLFLWLASLRTRQPHWAQAGWSLRDGAIERSSGAFPEGRRWTISPLP